VKGQVWLEYILLVAIITFAFAYFYSRPFEEMVYSVRAALGYLAAENYVAEYEINAGTDAYIGAFITNPTATEINISGEYNADALRTAVLNAVSGLGVQVVNT